MPIEIIFVKSLHSSYRKELQGTNCNLYLVDRTQTVQLRSNLRNVLPLLYFTLLVGRVIPVSSGRDFHTNGIGDS